MTCADTRSAVVLERCVTPTARSSRERCSKMSESSGCAVKYSRAAK